MFVELAVCFCILLDIKKTFDTIDHRILLMQLDQNDPGWGSAGNRLWSDRPRPKWPLIRRECARRSLCARSALEAASNQASSRPKWPLIRQVPDHCPDEFHTIVQTKVRSKWSDQRMILNMNKSLNIVIIYSFHISFYQSYIQLTKNQS